MDRPARHLPFFTLMEAIPQPGCVLCRLIETETRRLFESLLYESVNDPAFRRTWRRGHGVCQRHTWMLGESADALGMGILYLDLIESQGVEVLETPTGTPCFACEQEQRWLREHLEVLVEHWQDADLQQALRNSEGFCGPHLRAAMRIIHQRPIQQALRELSLRSLSALIPRMKELIESFDYQHAKPTDPRIKFAWREAMEKLAGTRNGGG